MYEIHKQTIILQVAFTIRCLTIHILVILSSIISFELYKYSI